jgi:hypothetical protein
LRLRDRNRTPWTTRFSPLFETAFSKRAVDNEGFWDVLLSFDDAVRVNPRAVGELHPGFGSGTVWVYESPPIARLPPVKIVYEIDDEHGVVILWDFVVE